MTTAHSIVLSLGALALTAATAAAQVPSASLDYRAQIYGPAGYANFGTGVRASETSMLVKSGGDSALAYLHVLVDDGAGWTYDRRFNTATLLSFDCDGSLAVHGDENAGVSRMIAHWRAGGLWSTVHYYSPDVGSGGTNAWAACVAVDGTTVVVSDHRFSGGLSDQGALYFYEDIGSQLVLRQRFLGGTSDAWLGRFFDVAGDFAIATFTSPTQPPYGVRTYRRSQGVWSVEQDSVARAQNEVWDVRASEEGLAALRRNTQVDVLVHGPQSWFVDTTIPSISGNWVIGLDVSEGVVVAGHMHDDGLAPDAGALRVWARNGGWQAMDVAYAADGRALDYLGRSVSIVGGRVYATAQGDDDQFMDAGAIYEFAVLHSPAQVVCTTAASSDGCVARIAFAGSPSATDTRPFDLTASDVRTGSLGFLLYGTSGVLPPALNGGVRCVAPTRYRTAFTGAGGTVGLDCDGAFGVDFNALVRAGTNPELVAGATVTASFVFRDPLVPGSMSASEAAQFTILP